MASFILLHVKHPVLLVADLSPRRVKAGIEGCLLVLLWSLIKHTKVNNVTSQSSLWGLLKCVYSKISFQEGIDVGSTGSKPKVQCSYVFVPSFYTWEAIEGWVLQNVQFYLVPTAVISQINGVQPSPNKNDQWGTYHLESTIYHSYHLRFLCTVQTRWSIGKFSYINKYCHIKSWYG